jgi:hypothetical protein
MRYKNRSKTQRRIGQKEQKPSDFEKLAPAPDLKLAEAINSADVMKYSLPTSPETTSKKLN